MKDYTILHADGTYDSISMAMSSLETMVNDYLNSGYTLIGGVSMSVEIVYNNSYFHFAQAVAKE